MISGWSNSNKAVNLTVVNTEGLGQLFSILSN